MNYDLGAYNEKNLYIRFQLVSDANSPGQDGVHINGVTVSCLPDPPLGAYYAYLSGTSMATPMVSGLAALIEATAPDLTNLQVEEVIQDSVDPKTGLAGKVRSGGRINAYRAINMATLGWPSLSAAGDVRRSQFELEQGGLARLRVTLSSAALSRADLTPPSPVCSSGSTTYSDTGASG